LPLGQSASDLRGGADGGDVWRTSIGPCQDTVGCRQKRCCRRGWRGWHKI